MCLTTQAYLGKRMLREVLCCDACVCVAAQHGQLSHVLDLTCLPLQAHAPRDALQ